MFRVFGAKVTHVLLMHCGTLSMLVRNHTLQGNSVIKEIHCQLISFENKDSAALDSVT